MSTPPTASQTLFTVQALRGLAAVLVIAHHTSVMASRILPGYTYWGNGAAGVDIFFVISGLVLVLSSGRLAGTLHPARTFALRRLERIVPLYWIVTSIQLALDWLAPAYACVLVDGPRQIFGSYFFVPTFRTSLENPILNVGWTMNYEVLFYALFALVLFFRLSPTRVLVPLLLVLGLAGPLFKSAHWGILLMLNPLLIEFGYGVLIGAAVRARLLPGLAVSRPLAILALAIIFFAEPHAHVPRFLLWGLPAAALVTAAAALEPQLHHRLPRWLLLLGDASYSLYLLHQLILFAVSGLALRFALNQPHTVVALSFAAFALCIAAGVLCYRFVELPILKYFSLRRRASYSTAQPA